MSNKFSVDPKLLEILRQITENPSIKTMREMQNRLAFKALRDLKVTSNYQMTKVALNPIIQNTAFKQNLSLINQMIAPLGSSLGSSMPNIGQVIKNIENQNRMTKRLIYPHKIWFENSLLLKNITNTTSIYAAIKQLTGTTKDIKFIINENTSVTVSYDSLQESIEELKVFEFNETELMEIASITSIIRTISVLSYVIPEFEIKFWGIYIAIGEYINNIYSGLSSETKEFFKGPEGIGRFIAKQALTKAFPFLVGFAVSALTYKAIKP